MQVVGGVMWGVFSIFRYWEWVGVGECGLLWRGVRIVVVQ